MRVCGRVWCVRERACMYVRMYMCVCGRVYVRAYGYVHVMYEYVHVMYVYMCVCVRT